MAPSMRNSMNPMAVTRFSKDSRDGANMFSENQHRDRVLSDVAESYRKELEEGREASDND